jgi:hypothetical protein
VHRLAGEIYRYVYNQYLFIPIGQLNADLATTKSVPPWNLGKRIRCSNYRDLIRQR